MRSKQDNSDYTMPGTKWAVYANWLFAIFTGGALAYLMLFDWIAPVLGLR